MSLIDSPRRVQRPNASIAQVVVGVLVSLFALLTVQMAAFVAWADTFGMPGGFRGQRVDELGRPMTDPAQVWHQYGPLLWAVYALALVAGVVWMWRTILTRPPRAAWAFVPVLLAATAAFWLMNLDRFSL